MRRQLVFLIAILFMSVHTSGQSQKTARSMERVKTRNGLVEGKTEASGVTSFKGIPFAAPPTGENRWKAPQPPKKWTGVRKATEFGNRPVQPPLFSDMVFRSKKLSEDCLYLNVWTPARSADEKLPVLVYFYGGGFVAGDGSEPRYDGESMAQKGIVALTVNYRLGVFGLLAHPDLSREAPYKSSGNYGLLDQAAALKWVHENIAAFGGDPSRVTIAGESAGSMSVSAQMASPLSKNLIAGAIGESGSLLGERSAMTLKDAEDVGVEFAKAAGAKSIHELRRMRADSLVAAHVKFGAFRFSANVDGYFFPKDPEAIYDAGEQAQVPLLVGWNNEEMNYRMVMGLDPLTKENYEKAVRKLYKEKADEVLRLYPAATAEDVEQAATDLAGDRFIGFSTWKWADVHSRTGGRPVFRYLYERPRPAKAGSTEPGDKGAVHSAEIEYAMGNLATNKVFDWKDDDYTVSTIMQTYFANFIRSGDPNKTAVKDNNNRHSIGLPEWPPITGDKVPVMHIDVNTRVEPEKNRQRYLFLDED